MLLASSCAAFADGLGDPEDCNGNGVPDAEDIADGTSLDCNGDGLPDECQSCLDPDGNGLLDPCELAAGEGLSGQYWQSIGGAGNFSQRLFSRIDPQIDFNFDGDPTVPVDEFCVRWTGLLRAPVAGTYTFWTTTDDGVRLWIDGVRIINKWQPQSPTTWSASIDLDGDPVSIRMDYYEAGGGALARLEWRTPGGEREVIPASALQPLADLDGDGWSDAAQDCDLDGVVDAQSLLEGHPDCDGNCVPDFCDVVPAVPTGYWRFEKGAVFADSGPWGLDAIATATATLAEVPVATIPQTGAANLLARNFGGTGSMVVADPEARLSFAEQGFTIEAWVRLAGFGGTGGPPERRLLVQRKPADAGDGQLEYAFYAQIGDLAGAIDTIFGDTGSISGREMAIRFGNGGSGTAGTWAAISSIEISGGDWHFISVAFDPIADTVRFSIDGVFETVPVGDLPRVESGGPLLVGAHSSANGSLNQFFGGDLDELRITRGVLDPKRMLDDPRGLDCDHNGVPDACDIADGLLNDCNLDGDPDLCDPDCDGDGVSDVCEVFYGNESDCNGNGILDACEIAADPAIDCDGNGLPDECQLDLEDCNGNGIVDACDLAAGTSGDCDSDGVPDECQLGEPLVYAIDDGAAEFGIRSEGTRMAWLTRFSVDDGAGVIEALQFMFVFLPENATATIGVWSDPNGDGVPDDAQLLRSKVVNTSPLSVFRTFDIQDVAVGPTGTSFFVGAWMPVTESDFPAPLDTNGEVLVERCWLIGYDSPIDPNDLAAGAVAFETIEQALFPGKWLIRAVATTTSGDCNQNGVPDECDIDDGTSADRDGTGIPDECEDCNGNGILDSSDVASGVSLDCNGDLVPDECQIFLGDCNQNGVPDACELEGNDCNQNSLLDECDIAAGISEDFDGTGVPDECEDCNGNGTLDSIDVFSGVSLDCNGDLVPDECQFGPPPLEVEYALDDGSREGNYGVLGVADYVWLNQFQVEPGGETIGTISVVLGNIFSGTAYEVVLWSDPNGDGEPDDAEVLASAAANTANANTSVFNDIAIVPTYVGPPGTSFFAGAFFHDEYGNQTPIPADNNSIVALRSWVSIDTVVDPEALADAAIYGILAQANTLVRAYGFDGALPNDCNQNGVPDDCDIADGLEGDANANGIPDSCEGCLTDLDADGLVGPSDLATVLASWSIDGSCGECAGDIDGDGVVGAGDLAQVLATWGPCDP